MKIYQIIFFLIVCAVCVLLLRINVGDPVEQVVQAVLDEPPTNEDKGYKSSQKKVSPELENFLSWYMPMVKEASPEVRAVMKKFDAHFRSGWANRSEEIEQWYPTDQWIQRLLDMGISIDNYSNYSAYLNTRWSFYHAKNDPEELSAQKDSYGLAADAPWEEVLDAGIRFSVKLHTLTDQAMAVDSRVYGGELSKDGVFIPIRLKTVYMQPGTMTSGSGVPDWVPHELRRREQGFPLSREIPDDIARGDIIYLDEKGQAIKDRVPPSGDDVEGGSTGETDTGFDSANGKSPLADDFDNSFPDDLPPSNTESYEFEKLKFPQSVTDIEKQLTPQGIEAELSEGLSPERFNNAQQLIDQYGTEEGLRRLREMDPEAARRFERERRPVPPRDVPDEEQSESGSKD